MASVNNWLGFSTLPKSTPIPIHDVQDHSQSTASRLGIFHTDEISGADVSDECFDEPTSDSTAPSSSIHDPAPFSILEALRNNQSRDWNMKGLGMNPDINHKTSSAIPMLMGTRSSNGPQNQLEPKLEKFVGGKSFGSSSHHEQKLNDCSSLYEATGGYMFQNCFLQLPCEATTDDRASNIDIGVRGEDNNSINKGSGNSPTGLSMIKPWLRNRPAQMRRVAKTNGGGAQSLSLSISTESRLSGTSLPLQTASGGNLNNGEDQDQGSSPDSDKRQNTTAALDTQTSAIEGVPIRKSIDTFGQRTSIYRGVTRHRWTGRYEAHLWDNSCRREGQIRKGRQVYLGGYDKEEKAARAYDLAALKYWGSTTTTNFPIRDYEKELEEMKHMTKQEFVASLRRKSSGFSRGASIYRGVTRHHQHGRWQARIGRVAGNKDLYLGTFSTQEEAAEAYDIAAIKFRGLNAITNLDMSRYDVNSILETSALPIGGAANTKRLKDVEPAGRSLDTRICTDSDNIIMSSRVTDGIRNYGGPAHPHAWPTATSTVAFHRRQAQPSISVAQHYHPYYHGQSQRLLCKQEQDPDTANNHSHQLDWLQLGNAHDFFQSSSSALHNLMNADSHSMEHSSGYNSVVYSNGGGGGDGSYQGVACGSGSGGYAIPVATVMGNDDDRRIQGNGYGDRGLKAIVGYDSMFGVSSDP